jgi:hypothetical protein
LSNLEDLIAAFGRLSWWCLWLAIQREFYNRTVIMGVRLHR